MFKLTFSDDLSKAVSVCELFENELPLLTQTCLCFVLQEMVSWETQPGEASALCLPRTEYAELWVHTVRSDRKSVV